MTAGTVQWFNASKGYGVVKPVDGGFSVFVRIGAVARAGFLDLKEGQIVNFDIVVDDGMGSLFAENLSIQVSESPTLRAPPRTDWATGFYQHYGWWTMIDAVRISR
jgi:CspA family cold shock protein